MTILQQALTARTEEQEAAMPTQVLPLLWVLYPILYSTDTPLT